MQKLVIQMIYVLDVHNPTFRSSLWTFLKFRVCSVLTVSSESLKPESSRTQVTPACLRRSGSFNLGPDNFKTSDTEIGKYSLPLSQMTFSPMNGQFSTFRATDHVSSLFFLCSWHLTYLFYSGTQGTRTLKQPWRCADIYPLLKVHCPWLLPAALVPPGHTHRKQSYSDTAPWSCRLSPLNV